MPRTLILGAGFGGIGAAIALRHLLPDGHEIVLVDRADGFSMGLRKLWELVGIGTIADGTRSRRLLDRDGIEFLQEPVEAIDPGARAATVGGRTIEADHLVVALGAEARPDLVPGLAEHAHDVWDPAAVPAAAAALESFAGGRVAVVIAGAPYPCPPAPYECAMLLDEHLRERGLRERTELVVTTFQPILLPNAGRPGSEWLQGELDERGIEARAGLGVERLEAGRVVYAGDELEADLVIGVPPHRPPAPIAASGLTAGDWVAVDPGTLATAFDDVFAVGDVVQIKLANGLPLPKAGVIAEAEGRHVAATIAARIQGLEDPDPFPGHGQCFVETGRGRAALIEGEFYAEPEPAVHLRPPSPETAAAKRAFERERLVAWFGG